MVLKTTDDRGQDDSTGKNKHECMIRALFCYTLCQLEENVQ